MGKKTNMQLSRFNIGLFSYIHENIIRNIVMVYNYFNYFLISKEEFFFSVSGKVNFLNGFYSLLPGMTTEHIFVADLCVKFRFSLFLSDTFQL